MAAQPILRERFLREARTAVRLSHPNIVPIYAVDEADDFVFFAMAYIEGETLGERVRGRGPLSSRVAVRVLREVAWALAHAHAQGVVHRDVKPDNILLEKDSGRALVTDFGIAHVGHEPGMTTAGEALGTAEFMSPEQASGEEVDARSDIYALGAVGFYALTSRFPFEGSTVAALLAKHITQPAPPVGSVAPEVPAKIAQAIDRCLRKPPEERYGDGAALAEAIGDGTAVARELPVALRLMIQKMRTLTGSLPVIGMAWVLLLPAGAALLILGSLGLWIVPELWAIVIFVASVLVALGLALEPVVALVTHARKLLEAGYGLDDVRLVLAQDVARRTEEIRFEFGKEVTLVDHGLRLLTWGSVATAFVGVSAALAGAGETAGMVAVYSLMTTTWSGIIGAYRNEKRRDAVGEGWLKVLRSRVGKWLFRLGGLGLGTRALSGGAHRPTEMAIGIAADRLFEELPKSTKRELEGLPDTVGRLEADAQKMRQRLEELDGVLAEIGDEPWRAGAEERAGLREGVEATRDEAERRMTEAVSALERIRLGLLRLHAGAESVESLTADLSSARELSEDLAHLLAGTREVNDLLGLRSPSDVSETPTPTPA